MKCFRKYLYKIFVKFTYVWSFQQLSFYCCWSNSRKRTCFVIRLCEKGLSSCLPWGQQLFVAVTASFIYDFHGLNCILSFSRGYIYDINFIFRWTIFAWPAVLQQSKFKISLFRNPPKKPPNKSQKKTSLNFLGIDSNFHEISLITQR